MLQIKKLQLQLEELQFSQNLYEQSFPIEERRDFSLLIDIYKNDKLELNIIYKGFQAVGILNLWRFDDFLYIEHLAVLPEHRNKNIASETLKQISDTSFPIVLEVELPTDEISARRIGFYQRNNYNIQPYKYYQPPYRKGEKPLEMHLMANIENPLKASEYQKITDTIRKKVYEKFW